MSEFIKKPAKRILYTIRKKTNVTTKDVCFGRYDRMRQVGPVTTLLSPAPL